MQYELYETVARVLSEDERLVVEGQLLRNRVVELARKNDAGLLARLLGHAEIKATFFTVVDGTGKAGPVTVFDTERFVRFVNNKQFLPDSYTAFENKIGLSDGDEFVSERKDVVLNWPYKDCVLEGGQTKEDSSRDEIFWNETLAPDRIHRLLDPKVFTNWKRVGAKGEKALAALASGSGGSLTDNLLLKGNNLLVLHSLKERFAGKVKLIYIDPPYNTGNDGFGYNDRFNHSAWLTFMKNRLTVARELLREDGSIWINIDDNESHYLKVLCDEIFGRENFVANVVWQKKYMPSNDVTTISSMHDHILVFPKDKSQSNFNLLERSDVQLSAYQNPDNDPRGPWRASDMSAKTYSKSTDYVIQTPAGKKVEPPESRSWIFNKARYQEMVEDNRIWFGTKGTGRPMVKKFLSEVRDGITPGTWWHREDFADNKIAKYELKEVLESNQFASPKPEKLIQKIIHIGTNEGDIVLDFFAGSGTTPAVAHKLGRQWIAIEQMDYIDTVTSPRLKKVLAGEQGGISKDVAWTGGGDFVYAELMPLVATYKTAVAKAKTARELATLWQEIQDKAFISYRLDEAKFASVKKDFAALDLTEQKRFITEMLDYNQLHLKPTKFLQQTRS